MKGKQTQDEKFHSMYAGRSSEAKLATWTSGKSEISTLKNLAGFLSPGDVVVFNNAMTIPASLRFSHGETGEFGEARIVAFLGSSEDVYASLELVLLGEGSWRNKTEERPRFRSVEVDDLLVVHYDFKFRVTKIHEFTIDVQCQSEGSVLDGLFKHGKFVQYYYHQRNLDPWDGQTIFASVPLALEPPSSGLHFDWNVVESLLGHGVEVATITHGTGLSTLGSSQADRILPSPEPYRIRGEDIQKIEKARSFGRKVIAVGTGVTRALETWGHTGRLDGITNVRLSTDWDLAVVDGIITGLHDEGGSHMRLLEAFISRDEIDDLYRFAKSEMMTWHEYGDLSLIVKNKHNDIS